MTQQMERLTAEPSGTTRADQATEVPDPKALWERRHVARLAVTDLIVLVAAVVIAMLTKFGATDTERTSGPIGLTYAQLGTIIVTAWWVCLIAFRTRDQRLFGEDAEEYRRVIRATLFTFSLLAIVSLLAKIEMSRAYLAIAFPIGMAAAAQPAASSSSTTTWRRSTSCGTRRRSTSAPAR